jgi:hypothetical protein
LAIIACQQRCVVLSRTEIDARHWIVLARTVDDAAVTIDREADGESAEAPSTRHTASYQ